MKRHTIPSVIDFENTAARDLQEQARYITKINSLVSEQLGIGKFQGDPLELIETTDRIFFGGVARKEYRGLDIVQRIIDSPAKEALRAGYKIETNFDTGLGIGKLFEERLAELKDTEKFTQFLINSRLYSRGGLMFPVIDEVGMVEGRGHLNRKLEDFSINRIESLNVPPEDMFFYHIQSFDALARDFGEILTINIHGRDIHKSRVNFAILGLDIFRQRGISVLDRILIACKALNIAEWTIANLLLRYRALIVKYPAKEIHQQTAKKKAKLTELTRDIMRKFTSKSVAAIPDNYEFEYLQTTFTGLNEATIFLYEYLSSVSGVPQSIIKGSAKGELASAEKDQRDYYETIQSEEQQGKLEPLIQFLKPMILNEKQGEIYPILMKHGLLSDDVELTVVFNPMHSVNPLQDAQINLIKAQTGAIDLQSGTRDADEIRQADYPNLDSSSNVPVGETDFNNPEPGGAFDFMQDLFDENGQLKPQSFANAEGIQKKYQTLKP